MQNVKCKVCTGVSHDRFRRVLQILLQMCVLEQTQLLLLLCNCSYTDTYKYSQTILSMPGYTIRAGDFRNSENISLDTRLLCLRNSKLLYSMLTYH